MRARATAGRILAAAAVLAALVAPATADAAKVKRPKAGQYIGETEKNHELTLFVSGRRARLELQCGAPPVTVRHLRLHRHKKGYTFASRSKHPLVAVTGRIGRSGTKARGRVRVGSARCRTGGSIRWSATHVKRPVKAPDAQYDGETRQHRPITLIASGRSIDLASFAFKCGYGDGRTSLNAVALRRTRKGYAFSIESHGNVTYSDGFPDENAEVDLTGRFNPAATRATGHIRVKSPRCGSTGRVPFTVKRVRSG